MESKEFMNGDNTPVFFTNSTPFSTLLTKRKFKGLKYQRIWINFPCFFTSKFEGQHTLYKAESKFPASK